MKAYAYVKVIVRRNFNKEAFKTDMELIIVSYIFSYGPELFIRIIPYFIRF